MNEVQQKVVDRVLKLFKLGDRSRNGSEVETLAAVTKARELMTQYGLSMADVSASEAPSTSHSLHVNVNAKSSYRIKGRRFALYDDILGSAVDLICQTRQILWQSSDGYVTRFFVGEEVDAAVASAMFVLMLDEMRRAARRTLGPGWSYSHTSYCIAYSSRVAERARERVEISAVHAEKMALVVYSKQTAIATYLNELDITPSKTRSVKRFDSWAAWMGRQKGDLVDLERDHRLRQD